MTTKNRKNIVLYGCGDMGFQTYNILKHNANYEVVGFLDDNLNNKGKSFLELSIYSDSDELPKLIDEHKIEGGIATIGNNKIRYGKNQILKAAGLQIITAIHPQALIDSPEHIGEGTIAEIGASIHPGAIIGEGVFLGGGSLVAHGSMVGKYSLIAGGVIFGGGVKVGDFTLVGVGASLSPYVTIGNNVLIGTGAAVTKNLPDNVVAVGVPARILRENC